MSTTTWPRRFLAASFADRDPLNPNWQHSLDESGVGHALGYSLDQWASDADNPQEIERRRALVGLELSLEDQRVAAIGTAHGGRARGRRDAPMAILRTAKEGREASR